MSKEIHTKIDKWALFIVFMIAAAPFLGSATTAAGLIASMIAMYLIAKERSFTLSSGQKYLLAAYLLYFFYYVGVGWARESLYRGFDGMVPNLPVLFFAALIVVLPTRSIAITYRQLGILATYAVLITAFAALVQHQFVGCRKVWLLAGNALPFAALMLCVTFLTALGWADKTKAQKQLTIAAIVFGYFTVIYLADSKGAALAGLPLTAVLVWQIQLGLLRSLAVVAAMLVSVFLLGQVNDAACGGKNEALDRYVTMANTVTNTTEGRADESISHRMTMWRAGFEAIKARPVFGHGPQNRASAAKPYFANDLKNYGHLHNTLITHMVGGGVVGLLLFLSVILSPLVLFYIYKKVSRDDWYLGLVIMGAAQTGWTNLLFNHDLMSSFFAFAPVVLLVMLEKSNRNRA